MRTNRFRQTKIPLILRVVSLYFVVSIPFVFAHTVYATPKVPIIQFQALAGHDGFVAPGNRIEGLPVRVQVASVGINLPVVNGSYDQSSDSWTLNPDKAQFATVTSKPNNQNGSTLIYGHDTQAVFAPLSGLRVGDTATVTTDNNHIFTYHFVGDLIIDPSMTSILSFSPTKPRLMLMTCDGIWSQSRRLMYFELAGNN